ncbi:MAG: SdiA-regulated domain-containing protein [Phycisphaerales bacterium]
MITSLRSSAGLTCFLTSAAMAQVSFTGSYFQNFDGLAQSGAVTLTGPGPHQIDGVLGSVGAAGWYGANFSGSSSNTEFKAHDGSLASSAGRGVIFFGTNGSTERALGALSTSNQIPSIGVVLTNTSSQTFASLEVSFVGEQWRAGDANIADVLSFQYGFGTSLVDATTPEPSLNFATVVLTGGNTALNGNDPANQAIVHGVIAGLDWAPGQSLVLRWNAVDISGQDNGLAIDNVVLTGVLAPPTSLNLANYRLTATYPLPPVSASEASAVTYNWDTGTLFVLGDEGDALVEVTTNGTPVSEMTLTGFDDTEGLTYIGRGQFVIVEERLQDVFLLDYAAGGTADRSALPGISLGPTVGNVGLEGISFDPLADNYVLVKEKQPQGAYVATLDWSIPAGSMTDLFVPNLGVADLSDVQVLSTVPSLVGTADQNNLLILSQESRKLLEVTRAGDVLSSFDFTTIASDAEGVTIGPDGTIYVVGETPTLYVLRPVVVPCPADLTGDGSVGADDLGVLLGAWGSSGAADLDADGTVGPADLAILLGAWGACS